MNQSTEYAWITPGVIVAVDAMDWSISSDQLPADYEHHVMRGTVYGYVVRVFDEGLSIAHQMFHEGGRNSQARQVTTIPWGTIIRIMRLVEVSGWEPAPDGEYESGARGGNEHR